MNDDFLHKHRQAPPKAFADNLYRQLQEENEDMTALPMTRTYARRTRFPVGAAALFAILLVGVLLALRPTFIPPMLTQIDTSFLDALQPITPENANELTQVAQLGRGRVFDVDWHGDIIAVGGALGVWLYDSTHLTEAPRLLAGQQTMYARRVSLTWHQLNPLVAAPDGDTIRVWNAETGEEVGAFSDGDDKHWDVVAISPDGRYVAGGEGMLGYEVTQRWALNVWDVETGELVSSQWETEAILNLDFNPTRLYQLAVQSMSRVFVMSAEVTNPQIMAEINTEYSNLNVGLDFSTDGETVAFAAENKVIIWNSVTQLIDQEIDLSSDVTPYITDIAFSADGVYLAIATRNLGALLWNRAQQKWMNGSPDHPPYGNFESVDTLVFNNALRSSMLASVRYASTLSVFSFGTGRMMTNQRDFTSPITVADLNVDDRTVATGGLDGAIHLWSLETGEERYTVDTRAGFLSDLVFSLDGSVFAYSEVLSGTSGGIKLVDTATGEQQRQLGLSTHNYFPLAFSPSGATLAAGDNTDTNIQTWLWATEENQAEGRVLIETPAGMNSVRYTPDGAMIVNLTRSEVLRFFDAETGEQKFPLNPPLTQVIDVDFSPDGSRMAVGQQSGNHTGSLITVYDFITGEEIMPIYFETNTDLVTNLTFSPDGSLIAAIVDENRLHVWDAATGALLFDHGDEYILNSQLMFSGDGRLIVTADWDGLIRVWGIPE